MGRPKKDIGAAFAIVAKDILENNQNIADVGIILGALGEDSLKWLKDLKAECATVDEFIEIARQRADISLIVAAVKCALGYEYEEVDTNYIKVPDGYDGAGRPKMREVESSVKRKKRHSKKNDALLRFILKCRLPEYFQDTQRIEINKKVIELKGDAEKQIRELARSFSESLENKGIGGQKN